MNLLSLALLASSVVAHKYQFFADTGDSRYSGKALFANGAHDPAFLSDHALLLEYDEKEHVLRSSGDEALIVAGEKLVLGNKGASKFVIENNYLKMPARAWACETKDSNKDNIVLVKDTKPHEKCVPVEFRAVLCEASEPHPPSPTYTHPHWNQTTTTKTRTLTTLITYCPEETTLTVTTCDEWQCLPTCITVTTPTTVTVTDCIIPPQTTTHKKTVTDYTTYCPTETTFTVTTCDVEKCYPSTVSVTGPTTVTITSCEVPETHPTPKPIEPTHKTTSTIEAPKAPTTTHQTTSQKTTVEGESHKPTSTAVPTVSFENGVAMNAVPFLAGVAGFIAVLA